MSKHPDDMFFPFSKDEPLRTSYTIYDLHGLALPRHGSPPTINSFDPEVELKKVQKIKKTIYEMMCDRCRVIPNFFGVDHRKDRNDNTYCRLNNNQSSFELKHKELLNENELLKDFRNYVDYPCKERFKTPDIWENKQDKNTFSSLTSFAFGKLDLITLLPLPHPYWSSIFRSYMLKPEQGYDTKNEIHNYDILNIPTQRVKYGYFKNINGSSNISPENEITTIEFLKPYILFILIRFPSTLIKKCVRYRGNVEGKKCNVGGICERNLHVKRFCKELFCNENDVLFNKKTNFLDFFEKKQVNKNDPRLELFLTFTCHYQAIIKAEFDNFHSINSFISKIRDFESNYLLDDTASIVSLNSRYIAQRERRKEILRKEKVKTNDPGEFELLLKYSGIYQEKGSKNLKLSYKQEDLISKEVESILKNSKNDNFKKTEKKDDDEFEKAFLEDIEFKIYHRPFFWDILVYIKTRSIFGLSLHVMKNLRACENITHAVTLPLWNVKNFSNHIECNEKDTIMGSLCDDWSQRVSNALNKAERSTERIKRIIESIDKKKAELPIDLSMFNDDENKFLKYRNILNELDVLSYRIYNIKFDIEWFFGYLNQLEVSWLTHLVRHPIRTFELLLERLEDTYNILANEISNLSQKNQYLSVLRNSDFMPEYFFDCDYDFGGNCKKFVGTIEDAIKNNIEILWKYTKQVSSKTMELKTTISDLIFEHNDKQEGSQIAWMTAPYLRIGSRTGVIDLYSEAINDLFTDYCGWLKNFEDHELTLWQGLVTPSSGKDFRIVTQFQVLHMPVDIKFHPYGRLPILAHEAAHFVLWSFRYGFSDYLTRFNSLINKENKFNKKSKEIENYKKKIKNVKSKFKTEFWDKWIDKAIGKCEDALKNYVRKDNIITNLIELKNNRMFQPSRLEILVDVLAGLIAGPAYFKCFGYNYYYAIRNHKASEPTKRVYPVNSWVRVFISLMMWKPNDHLNEDEKDEYDWLEKYWKMNTFFYDLICNNNPLFMINSEENVYIRFLNYGEYPSNQDEYDEFFYDYNSYLLWALFDHEKTDSDKKPLINIFIEFIRQIFNHEFMFFPDNGGVSFGIDDKNQIIKIQENCILKSQHCLNIARELVFNSSVILTGRLKDVSASTILYPVTRPTVPIGRIIHSLFYGTGLGDKNGQ